MKWVERVWVGLLYAGILGSAWVLTARDAGRALVAEVEGAPRAVLALICVIAAGVVVLVVWASRHLGPVRASQAELMMYDRPRGALRQLGVVACAGLAPALVLGTLVVCVGVAHPNSFATAIAAAVAVTGFAIVWPGVAALWQKRGSELIPRWRLIAADSRSRAISTSVLLLDTTAMSAAADLERAIPQAPRTDQVREWERDKNVVDVSRLGSNARRRTSAVSGARLPRKASGVMLAVVTARRCARAHAVLLIAAVLGPVLVASLGSAKLALSCAVVFAMIVGGKLSRTVGELASLHRLRRQWAHAVPGAATAVTVGVVLLGVCAVLVSAGGTAWLTLSGDGSAFVPRSGSFALYVLGWVVTVAAAAACGILGTAAAAVKAMQAEIKFIYSPEFGPMPMHIIERFMAGRAGVAVAFLLILNGFSVPAIVVGGAAIAWNVAQLREEISTSDYVDSHPPQGSVLA